MELAGGLLVPYSKALLQIEVAAGWKAPVVLCARTALGTINHTLLTLQALRTQGLDVAKVVMVGDPNPDNREAIQDYGDVEVDELPWIRPLTPEGVRAHRL